MECAFRIRLLTGNDLVLDGVPTGGVSGARPRALFVVLALHAQETLSRDWLAHLLWPEASQDAARQSLRMALHNLRRSLPDDWSERVEATSETVRLAVERTQVDYFRLEIAAQHDRNPTAEIETSFGGGLLAQFPEISRDFDDFLSTKREYARGLYVSGMTELLRMAAKEQDRELFVRRQRLLMDVDPTDDVIAEISMEFWANLGMPQHVEQVYEAFRKSFEQSYDAEPPAALEKAFAAHHSFAKRQASEHSASEKHMTPFGEPGKSASVRIFERRHWLVFLAVILCTGSLIAVYSFTAERSLGLVIEILPPEVEQNDCMIETVAERYRNTVVDALSAAEVSTIVLGNLLDYEPELDTKVYELRQAIHCSGNGFRGITTIINKNTRHVVWSAQHDEIPPGLNIDDALAALR